MTTLYSFGATGTDGNNSWSALVLIGSVFYGTTANNGANSFGGTIFSINDDGTGYITLHSFGSGSDGITAQSPLLAIGSVLYGTTASGGSIGAGTIFSINSDGTGYATLHSFDGTHGDAPVGPLITDGTLLYGTCFDGGTSSEGVVFSITTSGTGYTILHNFGSGSDGSNPACGLVLIGSTLYGVCEDGGAHGEGTIWSITTGGSSYTTIHSFGAGSDGANPYGALVTDGTTLYGTCKDGGFSGYGSIFSTNTSGSSYSTLHSFDSTDGSTCYTPLIIVSGVLYGVCYGGGANGKGTLFSITTAGASYTDLWDFGSGSDGQNPQGALFQLGTNLYGTCVNGGANGEGTIFSFPLPVSTVTPSLFTLTSTLETPSLIVDSKIEPSVFSLTTTLHSPSIHSSSTVSPSVLTLTSALLVSNLIVDSTITPSLLTLESTLYSPVVGANLQVINPSEFELTTTLYSPNLIIDSVIEPLIFSLATTLYAPNIIVDSVINSSVFSLTTTLHSPSLIINSVVNPSLLNLVSTLYTPAISPAINLTSNIVKIISYNPLIAICDTNPVSIAIIDTTSSGGPTWDVYHYSGVINPIDINVDGNGNVYIACGNGNILTFNISTPTSYSVISTGVTTNLMSVVLLLASNGDISDVFSNTDYSTGEIVDMFAGNNVEISTDIRFNQSVQNILGTFINTSNGAEISTDVRFSALLNDVIGCDIRFIDEAFSDLSITPISRPDFVVYIDDVEVTDVQLESIEITHTADEKSQATFILARQHDNVNYMLDNTYFPITGQHTVKITIAGHEEFGYNTPAYIWDIDTKSETETVKVMAYSELPQQDNRSSVTLSIPGINDKLHVYHVLINDPTIDNPNLLADDINPPFYQGILIDNGYQRIQNISQFQGLTTIGQTEEQFVNYVFGSGDSGVYDINGNTLYYKPIQNWTYFWFGHATNFVTGETWEGLLNNGSSYLGTSPSSLTSKSWDVDYINFWYQRQFPDSIFRGTKSGVGVSIVYPSDFLGIQSSYYDEVLGLAGFDGDIDVDAIIRNHTAYEFTGADILTYKTRLALLTNPGTTLATINGINYLVSIQGTLTQVPLNMSTHILDVIDSKFGVRFGSAPWKKVSCKSGIFNTSQKWEDAPNGLFFHKDQGYDYTNYVTAVGLLELKKIQNINGSILPKTKCDIETFIDGYYFYGISLLKRINIDNTIETNIYNNNNGFPVSVKSIHISAKTMKVTLQCTNAWSRLEMFEIEAGMPDPYYYLVPETILEYSPKFDPNSLTNAT